MRPQALRILRQRVPYSLSRSSISYSEDEGCELFSESRSSLSSSECNVLDRLKRRRLMVSSSSLSDDLVFADGTKYNDHYLSIVQETINEQEIVTKEYLEEKLINKPHKRITQLIKSGEWGNYWFINIIDNEKENICARRHSDDENKNLPFFRAKFKIFQSGIVINTHYGEDIETRKVIIFV